MIYIIEYTNDINWSLINNYCLENCDYIEFNVLYEGDELDEFIRPFRKSYIQTHTNDSKSNFVKGTLSMQFKLDSDLKMFLRDKPFHFFLNKPIEDITYYVLGKELVATITHENLIMLNVNNIDSESFDFFTFNNIIGNVSN